MDEEQWEDLTPGAYRIIASAPVRVTGIAEDGTSQVLYGLGSWKEHSFRGGTGSSDSITGEYIFYFDIGEDDGALTICPDGAFPMTVLSLEDDTPVAAIELPLTVDGAGQDVAVYPIDGIDPVLLEEGRTYKVFSAERLAFTGAEAVGPEEYTDPETGDTVFIYTISVEESGGSSAVVITRQAPVYIELSGGAAEICEDYDTPDGSFYGWSGSGSFTAGSFTFYQMEEKLVIEGTEDWNCEESEDGFTYTFTAEPGAYITIRLSSEPEYVFEPMASLTLTEAAAGSLSGWENDYESGVTWPGNGMYPVGDYTFTFAGKVQVEGAYCDIQMQEDGSSTCTFTLSEEHEVTINVIPPLPEPSVTISLSDAALEGLTGWSIDGETSGEWEADASHAPGIYSFTFTGKALITGAEDFTEEEAGGAYTYTFTASDEDVINIDLAPAEEKRPAFKTKSLRLSGDIGVDFYLDLSMLEEEERQASYVTFTVGRSTEEVRADYRSDFKNVSGEYYGFTCYVTSIQMADQITAVYHYGDSQTVTQTYSVKEYIDYIVDHSDYYSANTLALVCAIADYGHYVQPFLAKTNGWKLGEDYKEMPGCSQLAEADWNAARSAVEDHLFVRDYGNSRIEAMTYALNLISETSIRIFVKLEEGYSGTVTAKMGNTVLPCEEQWDGRWRIEITGIPAHRLSDKFSFTVEAGGECTASVSALAYVNTVLNSTNENFTNEKARNAVTSLYNYYAATIKYREKPNG